MRRTAMPNRRAGFTLVELIVVIGIIVLLVGLLLAAVAKYREVGPRVQTKAEIGELSLAIESFKSTYQVQFIPTALVMSNDYSATASPALQDSRQYISKVWPKAIVNAQTGWPLGAQRLDGNQVLLLLLGGLPPPAAGTSGHQGWLNSPTNPFQIPPDGSVAKGPFFTFKANRIRQNQNALPHYLDPYGNPYYYFSSRNGNDYEYFGRLYYQTAPDQTTNPDPFAVPGLTREGGFGNPQAFTQVSPFRGIDGKYINPNGFQIISMGRDGLPGRGSPCNNWEPNNVPWPQRRCMLNNAPAWTLFEPGIGDYTPGAQGGDDLANFAQGPLGGGD